jgi:Lar family restriction alleviation protein
MSFGIPHEHDDRLKPCPFCGAEAWLQRIEYEDGDIYYNPQCSECRAGWMESYGTKEEAISAWNVRNNKGAI